MAHAHSVYDSDRHFSIDPITRAITNEFSTKNTIVQNDHNSERFTFELPRYIEGHDMSICDRVEVHYINIDSSTKASNGGVYEVDDLQISPEDNNIVICSWLVSNNATKYEGVTSFLLRFACTTDGEISYVWNTAIYTNINVAKGIYNSGVIVEDYADVLAQWHQDLFETGGDAVVNIKDAEASAIDSLKTAADAKTQEVLASIPDDYKTLDANVTEYKAKIDSLSNAVKGNLSGAVVRADDVSPVEHSMDVRVRSKNLCLTNEITVSGAHPWANKFLDETITLTKGVYTISADFAQTGTKSFVSVSVRETDKTTQLFVKSSNEMNGKLFGTFEIAENIKDVRVVFYSNLTENIYDTSCAFTNIQIEEGPTLTEYTPYVDPASVTVTRCGKNVVQSEKIANEQWKNAPSYDSHGVVWTVYDDRRVAVQGETPEDNYSVFDIALSNRFTDWLVDGATYTVSLNMTGSRDVELVSEIFDKNNGTVVTYIRDGTTFTVDKAKYTYGTLRLQIAPAKTVSAVVMPQIEVGTVATGFEPYNATTYTPTTDGTILDMTSLSPTMTLLTDKEGAIVECEYNKDLNAVVADIYDKIAALAATT